MSQHGHSFLAVKNVSKHVFVGDREHIVLKNITATFRQGEYCAITGPSGSGKTTLLYLLAGLDVPTSGHVFFQGTRDLAQMNDRDRLAYRQSVMGLVFQFHYLIYELTALENIMIPALMCGIGQEIARKRAQELLEFVGLSRVVNSFPPTLSGGERQRIAIARALINKPAFIIADEPTGSLDEVQAGAVRNLFVAAQHEFGAGIIVATHDAQLFKNADHRIEF